MPLHAERKARCFRNPYRLDGAVFGDPFDDDPLAWFEDALAVQRIDADGLAAEDARKGAIGNETDLMAVGEDDVGIGVDVAVLQPRHPVVHASRQFADLGMQRAAEGDVHLLKAPADAEQGYTAGDAGFRQSQRQIVTMEVVRLMPGIRLGTETRRMNIGAGARQHHAIDRIQQGADIGDLGGGRKHQGQRASDFGDRTKISLSDHLRRKTIFDAIGASDHTDHRPPHRLESNPASQNVHAGSCLSGSIGSTC